MRQTSYLRSAVRWGAAGAGLAAATYATYIGVTWRRYGHPSTPIPSEEDRLLDRFIPAYEVVERHRIQVSAPAEVTMASPFVRAIFKGRELVLGAAPDARPRPRGLLALTQSLGWGVLAELPGREVVVGAVTRPWEANVTFRAIPADDFAAFCEPDYVKIVWTLRADPIGPSESIYLTETRVMTTDAASRAKFRRYWAVFSPGIWMIRWLSLGPLKREAERRAPREKGPQHAATAGRM
jgi:hypothetical protein